MRLVHFAVPLLLGSQPLGAVIAGQVFDQYPEQAVLEQVARQLGLSPTRLWQQARLEVPVKRDTLRVYADLLENLSQTFLQTRYDAIQEAERLAGMQRLQDTSTRLISECQSSALLDEILSAAIAVTHADTGTLQLLAPETGELRLQAWQGVGRPFVDFFACVQVHTGSACGTALQAGRRVVVPDVAANEIIAADALSVEVFRQSGIRAVQSTPITSRSGRMLGMISSHWRRPHEPAEHDLRLLDVLVRQAADLIERTQAEKELRESEERFRILVEAVSQAVWEIDARGVVVEDSPSWRAYTGQTLEAWLSYGWVNALHPDDRTGAERQWREAVTAGHNVDAEFRLSSPDGGWRWTNVRVVPLRDPDGAITKWVGMNLDITERKQAEAALETQRNWFDGTLSSIGDGVIATDVHSIIIFLNTVAEELTGWSAAEALGRPLDEVCRMINEQTREPVADNPVTLALRGDRTIGLANPTLLITRYGAELSIAHSAAPIRDRRGTRHGGVFVFRDSTATRRLEAQLRETQRMEALGTLAGGIAHGFNNMLAAILGFSELLRGEVELDSRAEEYLHEVRTAGLRAKDLVQQILTFSHRDVGKFAPFQLQLLVYETMRLLRASLPATIEICEHLNTTFGTVMGNPAQLQQVLMNLASNAEHAMRPTGGVLDVRLDDEFVTPDVAAHHPTLQPGSYLRLSVQDTGSGMTSDVLERIYEPFFTTKDVGQGTGMGLAIVHGIVTSHGGATTVASTPGQGSTFTVYLPRLADTAVADPAAVMPLPQGQERLLVVEDDTTLARLLQIQLTSLGYTVQVYTSSREALAAFQTSPPAVDLVLTDQTMPYMTGETLVQELRRLRPELPIILFTGYSPLIDAAKARALGIDAFLLKPLNTYDLAQTIRHVLEQRRTLRS
jgi:PAS domain S-box-containing protein